MNEFFRLYFVSSFLKNIFVQQQGMKLLRVIFQSFVYKNY